MICILQVDDLRDDFEITRLQLERISDELELEWAESAELALERLASGDIDCVLCDYQMPGTSGLELLQELRGRGDDIPFIFLTGQGNEELAAEALRAGADDYFSKEVGFAHYSRLLHSIKRVVQVHAERQVKRAAERALKESEETYRNLIELARDAIAIVQDERFKLTNPRFSELTGYSSREALDSPLEKLLVPEEYPKVREFHLRRLADDDAPRVYKTVMLHKDGSLLPVEFNATLISYKGANATLVIIRDIPQRMHEERKKGRKRELLRDFLNPGRGRVNQNPARVG